MSGIRERIFDRWFRDIHETRVAARVEALREAAGQTKHDEGWRRLTQDAGRDLSPITLDRQREIAVYLWERNPIARRIIEVQVEWVVGEGVQVNAKNPRTKEYLKRFWDHPVNRWDLKLPARVRELFLMGEQFWPAFQNQYSGLFSLGSLDPSRVKEVILDPDNAETVIGVITRGRTPAEERRLSALLGGDALEILSTSALAERERLQDGELFVFQTNKLTAQSRGKSDLFALADWLEGYEQLLFSILQQEHVRSQYVWDLTMEGATKEEIEEKLANLQPPRPLSVRVHNEKEKWQLVGPEAGGASANSEHARLFRNHVLGGAAIPEHWYGGGGDVNRATAAEMSGPTEKAMTARQRAIRYMLHDVAAVQVERGIESGALREEADSREISISMPDLSPKDVARISPSLAQLASGLTIAAQNGWVDDDTAAKVMAGVIAHLGVEADAGEMLKRASMSLADEVIGDFERRISKRQPEEAL